MGNLIRNPLQTFLAGLLTLLPLALTEPPQLSGWGTASTNSSDQEAPQGNC